MSFLRMGFPPKKDAIGRKSVSSSESSTETMMIDGGGLVFGEESVAGFWPVQHPVEPPLGEKPVQCPLPHPSIINEWRVSRSSFERKVAEPTSKRRHSVSHDGSQYRNLLFHNKSHNYKGFNNASTTALRPNNLNQFREH